MPRSIWTGSITFGLVNVPVKLYSAVSQKEVRFHMLHEKDGGRIRLKRFCSVEDEEVPYDEITKGYEIAKGQYVSIEREELEKFLPRSTKSIDIEDFVELGDIDPVFFEATYYLAPDKGADRAYSLLLEAMKRTNKVGVARIVLRTRQNLCTVRPKGNALVISTMNYADEIVSEDAIEDLPSATAHKPRDKELQMAEQLIESLTSAFEPDKYKDEYREKVLELIRAKAEGEKIEVEEEAPRGKVVDLMAALRASLKSAGKEQEVTGERRTYAHAAKTVRAPVKTKAKKTAGRKPAKARTKKPARKKKTG